MTDKKTRIVSNLLSLMLGAGLGAGCYRAIERIQHGGEQRIELEVPPEEVGGGVIINESEGSGMKLTATKLSSTEYAANGVSAQAESAYTLTATVMPSDATNKKVDWSVTFVNPSSSWATGKVITDYVTIMPSADGALSAVVTNLGEFGEQIKVTVTSRDNSGAYATCTVDYVQKVRNLTMSVGEISLQNGAETEVPFEFDVSLDADGLLESNGPGGVIEISYEFSEVYTISGDYVFEGRNEWTGLFLSGDEFRFELTLSETEEYSLYFDRTIFLSDSANGRVVEINGTDTDSAPEAMSDLISSWDVMELFVPFQDGTISCLILGYSLYSNYLNEKIFFESEVRFVMAEDTSVQNVTLDKGAIEF